MRPPNSNHVTMAEVMCEFTQLPGGPSHILPCFHLEKSAGTISSESRHAQLSITSHRPSLGGLV